MIIAGASPKNLLVAGRGVPAGLPLTEDGSPYLLGKRVRKNFRTANRPRITRIAANRRLFERSLNFAFIRVIRGETH